MNTEHVTRILVVDDTEANRYTIGKILERAGYHVMEACSGREALAKASSKPDLIILDVKLPDIRGTEVSKMLRSDPKTSHIPILQVSATFTLGADKAQGLDAGADAYLTSPVEPEELLAHIRMLLRLKEAQQALAKSNEWLKSVISQITDVYWALDPDWRFIEVNPAAEKFFGRPAAELWGKVFWEEFPMASFADFYRAAGSERRAVHFEGESRIRPGTWWEGHVYPREHRTDIFLRDITERKLYEFKLREAAAQLEERVADLQKAQQELAQARDLLSQQNEILERKVRERTARLEETIQDLETFSYSITHDMRAPLRAMQGFSKILQETSSHKLDPQETEYLNRIANSAGRLDLLIRDVLSYSNIIRSRLTLVPVNTDKLVRDIVCEYPGFQPPKAEIRVLGELPPVMGNEAFLTQCVSNLLGNAIKFVPPQTIPQVEVSYERSGGMVRLKVKDNGIGIPPEHQKNIFELFHRAQADYPGTGIGLAVVRKAVERMSGQVGFVSTPGRGSTFWLELKAANHQEPVELPGARPEGSAEAARKH